MMLRWSGICYQHLARILSSVVKQLLHEIGQLGRDSSDDDEETSVSKIWAAELQAQLSREGSDPSRRLDDYVLA